LQKELLNLAETAGDAQLRKMTSAQATGTMKICRHRTTPTDASILHRRWPPPKRPHVAPMKKAPAWAGAEAGSFEPVIVISR